MFGYIRPQNSELLVREFGEYKAVYCTLCRRLGKDYGPAARLVLNYDCTFYAILLLAISGKESPQFSRGRCVVNPLKQCGFCAECGDEFGTASALTVILTYYKVKDDIADSGFWKSLLFRIAYPFFSIMHRKASRRFPQLEKTVADAMSEQERTEHSDHPGIDCSAEPTACMLAHIFELAGGSGETTRVLYEAGYFFGRWTYLMDAADDIEKDIKKKTFNPFVIHFHLNDASTRETLDEAKNYANGTLNGTLAKLGAAINLLELGSFSPIVHNIVFLGLPAMQKEQLFKKENGNVRSV